jgi:hypothetical protein
MQLPNALAPKLAGDASCQNATLACFNASLYLFVLPVQVEHAQIATDSVRGLRFQKCGDVWDLTGAVDVRD